MTHSQFREWLPLLAYDELGTEERTLLEEHLRSCGECRTGLEELRALRTGVAASQRLRVTEALLEEARLELRAALRKERLRPAIMDRIDGAIDALLASWAKWSLAGVFAVALGFLGGYIAFSPPDSSAGIALKAVSDATDISRGEAKITNVRFDDADPSDDEIEFTFEAVTPVTVKGSPNDPGIQSVLTKALMTEENPGVRLRTVSAITSQIQIHGEKSPAAGDEVKSALIDAMKYDDNPGVRREALKALAKFPFDDAIKEGLLYVLGKDTNEGLRVEAINALATARDQIAASDEQVLDILRKRVESDNNRYVRLRARAVLEEVRQQ